MRRTLTTLAFPIGYIGIGLLIGGILFYLTPLKHITILQPAVKKIQPTVFYEAFQKNPDRYLLIDIRSEEFRAQEYVKQSIHIPLNVLVGELNALPKDKSIVIFCESNFSASAAYHVLQNNGFLDVRIIDGGRGAWKEAGLPLVQGTDMQKQVASEIINLKNQLRTLAR